MALPLCKFTLVGVILILALALAALVVHPVAAISFEAGLLAGVLLHSSHTKAAEEDGFIEFTDKTRNA